MNRMEKVERAVCNALEDALRHKRMLNAAVKTFEGKASAKAGELLIQQVDTHIDRLKDIERALKPERERHSSTRHKEK